MKILSFLEGMLNGICIGVALLFFIGVIIRCYSGDEGAILNHALNSAKKLDKIPTKETLKAYIIKVELVEPDICFKQAMLETGNLNPISLGCLNNNMFCFSFDGVGVLKFDTWQESILYYKFMQKYRWGIKKRDYYSILKKRWGAPDMKSYINKLKSM